MKRMCVHISVFVRTVLVVHNFMHLVPHPQFPPSLDSCSLHRNVFSCFVTDTIFETTTYLWLEHGGNESSYSIFNCLVFVIPSLTLTHYFIVKSAAETLTQGSLHHKKGEYEFTQSLVHIQSIFSGTLCAESIDCLSSLLMLH